MKASNFPLPLQDGGADGTGGFLITLYLISTTLLESGDKRVTTCEARMGLHFDVKGLSNKSQSG
jgi:hypothetical protein